MQGSAERDVLGSTAAKFGSRKGFKAKPRRVRATEKSSVSEKRLPNVKIQQFKRPSNYFSYLPRF